MPEPKEVIRRSTLEVEKMNLVDGDCAPKSVCIVYCSFPFSVLGRSRTRLRKKGTSRTGLLP
jgi:hypothetical protein